MMSEQITLERDLLDASEETQNSSGASLGDVLLLPAQQRKILNWITRQPNSSLAAIADHLGAEPDEVQLDLDALLAEGWIESRRSGGQAAYAVRSVSGDATTGLATGSTGSTDDTDGSKESLGKGLIIILNSSGHEVMTPGESFRLGATVTNKGRHSAIVDVLLDELPHEMMSWCKTQQECLALGSGHSGEAVFEIQVPVTAQPNIYEYSLIVDAPQHYPEETPIRYLQRLQILPAVSDASQSNDPTFIVQPTTQPSKPILLQPGGGVPVQILVQNRGDRVDRFRLTCPDMPPNWVQVTYPQSDSGYGVIMATDSLRLNPGEQGVIVLLISPPIDAIAGTQVPTIRLHSENHSDLLLSDWIYLQITANYLLQSELRSIVNRVQTKAGLFQVRFTNLGNTTRELTLNVKNLEESAGCVYQLQQSQIQVAPKATIGVDLSVKPESPWQRPFIGSAKMFNFAVELEDRQKLPLPSDRLTSFIILETRPWWQLVPFILLALGALGGFVYLVWWLFIRIPEPPKILDFAPEASQYDAINDEAVRLGWRISDPDRVQTVTVQGLSPDGKEMMMPMVYDLSQGLPEGLKPYCNLKRELICRNVRTSALKPGDYIFSLTTVARPGRGSAGDTKKSTIVKIEPIPKPQIISFNSTQPVYQEATLNKPNPIVSVVSSDAKADPKVDPKVDAKVDAKADPKVDSQPDVKPDVKPDGKPIATQPSEVILNWTIGNAKQLQAVHLIAKSPEGVILSPLKQFDLSKGIPPALKPFCMMQAELVCKNVKTGDRRPGNYIYELAAIGKGTGEMVVQKTDVIKLLPKAPQILSLTLNGQAANLPKYLVPITPNQGITTLLLAWDIEASEGSKVELLPTPGSIGLKGSLPFPLNPTPGALTLTLQVTSPGGAPIARTIVIETYDPNATNPAVTAAAAAAAAVTAAAANKPDPAAAGGSAATPGQATPAVPGQLSPIEVPPQSN